jgi:hypothetical protein
MDTPISEWMRFQLTWLPLGVVGVALYIFLLARLRRSRPTDAGNTTPSMKRLSKGSFLESARQNFGLIGTILLLFGRQNRFLNDPWAKGAIWALRLIFVISAVVFAVSVWRGE